MREEERMAHAVISKEVALTHISHDGGIFGHFCAFDSVCFFLYLDTMMGWSCFVLHLSESQMLVASVALCNTGVLYNCLVQQNTETHGQQLTRSRSNSWFTSNS